MSIAALADIGLKALRLQELIDTRREVATRFGEACFHWKHQRGIDFIAKHTDLWEEMLRGVQPEYLAIVRAKADETNARKRLERACRKAALAR